MELNYCFKCKFCNYEHNPSGYPYYRCIRLGTKLDTVVDIYNACASFEKKVEIMNTSKWRLI